MTLPRSIKVAPEHIGAVRRAFERRGKTQQVFADHLGIDRRPLSNFLSGKNVSRPIFVQICESLGVDVDEIKNKLSVEEQLDMLLDEIDTLIIDKASEEEIVEKEKAYADIKKAFKRRIKNKNIFYSPYRLKKQIASGGFSSVWRAIEQSQRKQVAVKILHSYYADIASYREDFLQSAEAMQKLQQLGCPNLVKTISIPQSSKKTLFNYNPKIQSCYYVMELIDGQNLYSAILNKETVLSEEKMFNVVDAVSKALIFSHQHGILHKDLKPQNILIDSEGNGFLTDFNLVVMKSESEQVSSSSAIGTYIYSPPEVLGYEDVDQRGDIYSLGMTVIFGLYRNHLPPEALIDSRNFISKRIKCSPEMKGVLLKATEFDPENRYSSVAEFHTALFAAWENRNQQLISVPVPSKEEETVPDKPYKFHQLKPFEISKFPVTNTEFSHFVEHGGYTKEGLNRWWSEIGSEVWNAYRIREEHRHMSRMRREDEPAEHPLFWNDRKYNHPAQPVVGVSWYEAEAYCNWLLAQMREKDADSWQSKIISLPTNLQWDFAGGGIWEYAYPWEHKEKSAPTKRLANFNDKEGAPSVVGKFPAGASWIGCHDMSGNVLEWCRDFHQKELPNDENDIDRCIRGGCFFDDSIERSIRISDLRGRKPAYRHSAIGFRIVVESISED